jgi:hypothetical protein
MSWCRSGSIISEAKIEETKLLNNYRSTSITTKLERARRRQLKFAMLSFGINSIK